MRPLAPGTFVGASMNIVLLEQRKENGSARDPENSEQVLDTYSLQKEQPSQCHLLNEKVPMMYVLLIAFVP